MAKNRIFFNDSSKIKYAAKTVEANISTNKKEQKTELNATTGIIKEIEKQNNNPRNNRQMNFFLGFKYKNKKDSAIINSNIKIGL